MKEQTPDRKIVGILWGQLRSQYDSYQGIRHEHLKEQCLGGDKFGWTVKHTWKRTKGDMKAVAAVTGVLYDIAKWPASGSIAWELRRFVKNATPDQIVEYAQLLSEVVRNDNGLFKDGSAFINMDDVFWNGSGACQNEIDRFKRVHFPT